MFRSPITKPAALSDPTRWTLRSTESHAESPAGDEEAEIGRLSSPLRQHPHAQQSPSSVAASSLRHSQSRSKFPRASVPARLMNALRQPAPWMRKALFILSSCGIAVAIVAVAIFLGLLHRPSHSSPLADFGVVFAKQQQSLALRHPLNVHMMARLFDKLMLGHPIVIGVLGGSISTMPSYYLHNAERTHYAALLIDWLHQHFPVAQGAKQRASVGIAAENNRTKHEVLYRAVGGMSSASSSFCWQELLDPESLPDLLLLDYSVNDAFATSPGVELHPSGTPLSVADNIDRLVRSILDSAEQSRLEKLRAARARMDQRRWTKSMQLSHDLRGSALFLLHFFSKPKSVWMSRQDSHGVIARRYGIPSATQRDFVLNHLQTDPLLHNNQTFHVDQIYSKRDGKTDGVHQNTMGHRLMFRLIQKKFELMHKHYLASNRASLEGTELAAHVIDSSALRADLLAPPLTPTMASDESAIVGDEAEASVDEYPSTSSEAAAQLVQLQAAQGSRRAHHRKEIMNEAREAVQAYRSGVEDAHSCIGAPCPRLYLPPIRSLPPLLLGRAYHPFNTEVLRFRCKKLYVPYAPSNIATLPALDLNQFFGIVQNQGWEIETNAKHAYKHGLAPSPSWIKAERAKVAANAAAIAVGEGGLHVGEQFFSERVLTLYPRLTIRIDPVRRVAALFYLRSWKPSGVLLAWLTCEDEAGTVLGKSAPQLLAGTWPLRSTQAAAAILWPPYEDFAGSTGPQEDSWVPPTPPCAFNRMHVVLTTPEHFLVIGHASA